MAPPAVGAQIRVLVAGKGGAPAGDEDELVESARQGLRCRDIASASARAQKTRFVWAMELVIRYLLNSLDKAELLAMTPEAFGDVVFEVFSLIVVRTKLPEKYRNILEHEEEWKRVCRAMVPVRHGAGAPAPTADVPAADTE